VRGDVAICDSPFSYTDREKQVRADHPPRVIREIINPVLKSLSGEFAKLYSPALGQRLTEAQQMRRSAFH
jgi:hypothetical protein